MRNEERVRKRQWVSSVSVLGVIVASFALADDEQLQPIFDGETLKSFEQLGDKETGHREDNWRTSTGLPLRPLSMAASTVAAMSRLARASRTVSPSVSMARAKSSMRR